MEMIDDDLPAPPLDAELWWVAVEGSQDPSGGWLVLADPGEAGALAIARALSQAGISFMAAASLPDLVAALDQAGALPTVAFRVSGSSLLVTRHLDPPAQVLLDLRLAHPADRILLVDDLSPAKALLDRMSQVISRGGFEGVRLDLRSPPRGQGAWGLALALA